MTGLDPLVKNPAPHAAQVALVEESTLGEVQVVQVVAVPEQVRQLALQSKHWAAMANWDEVQEATQVPWLRLLT